MNSLLFYQALQSPRLGRRPRKQRTDTLTPRRLAILQVLASLELQPSPSYGAATLHNIANLVGLKSLSTVHSHLHLLASLGYVVTHSHGGSRLTEAGRQLINAPSFIPSSLHPPVSQSQLRVLVAVSQLEGKPNSHSIQAATLKAIGQLLKSHISTVYSHLEVLERAGLVVKLPKGCTHLTEAGHQVLRERAVMP